jgi:hypothetical protein
MTSTRRCLLAVMLLGAGVSLRAADRKPEPHAVVAGTVFKESGFSLEGATVTLVPKGAAKPKPLRTTSDARGEFAFRVRPGPGTYVVKASMKGFQPAEKEASVAGEERVEVTLILSAESN